mgnify:CR=1 FL=1
MKSTNLHNSFNSANSEARPAPGEPHRSGKPHGIKPPEEIAETPPAAEAEVPVVHHQFQEGTGSVCHLTYRMAAMDAMTEMNESSINTNRLLLNLF